MAYLTLATFKTLTLAPASYADYVESLEPGWVDAQLAYYSAWIDSRLQKRYATPFAAPYPVAVTGWLARIVTWRLYLKRGVDPTDQELTQIKDDSAAALDEIKEAADSKEGLFELPLRADIPGSGITRSGPLGYSELSPYTWRQAQADARDE